MKIFTQQFADLEGFQWDTGNQTKSWNKHRVSTREAEEVFFNSPFFYSRDLNHSAIEERFACLGKTDEGRKLSLSFVIRDRKIRIVTARPMSRKERRVYEEEDA